MTRELNTRRRNPAGSVLILSAPSMEDLLAEPGGLRSGVQAAIGG
jgi:hypothetical protein